MAGRVIGLRQESNFSGELTPHYFICVWTVTLMTCLHMSYVSEPRGCVPGLWLDLLGDLTPYVREICNTYHEYYVEAHSDITQVKIVAAYVAVWMNDSIPLLSLVRTENRGGFYSAMGKGRSVLEQ